ncbi:MAG: co-chaperone GroES [Christensenellales bacterium]|jgi:chaperonin GroES
MKLKPLFDRVILAPKKNELKTSSGLVLPSASATKSQLATVVSVGDGGIIDGKNVEMKLKVGQTVIYSQYAGNEFKIDGEEYIIIKQTDILAVVEE